MKRRERRAPGAARGKPEMFGKVERGLRVRVAGRKHLRLVLRTQLLASNAELAHKLDSLEKKYDVQFQVVFDAIRKLMSPPEAKRRAIDFHVKHGYDKPKAKMR